MTAVRTHAEKLKQLGVCPRTFQREPTELVADLVAEGIPRIAANDIVHAAKAHFAEEERNKSMPMAIFWDIENVAIPTAISGTEIARRLKLAMQPFGSLELFNAYMSVGIGNVPEEKRSQLQLSGVHIIDTPHLNRKEVADKMIIVDALLFAHAYPSGCTIVLITGDSDFAYMLSAMQINKAWRTVLVTRGDMQTALHLAATSVVRWEADILRDMLHRAPRSTIVTPPALLSPAPSPVVLGSAAAAAAVSSAAPVADVIAAWDASRPSDVEMAAAGIDDLSRMDSMTDADVLDDDVKVLMYIMQALRDRGQHCPLKSAVGIELQRANPVAFGEKAARAAVFAQALSNGWIVEEGAGGTVAVRLSDSAPQTSPSENIGVAQPERPLQLLSYRAERISRYMPYVVVISADHATPELRAAPQMYVFVQRGLVYLFFVSVARARARIREFIEIFQADANGEAITIFDLRSVPVINPLPPHGLDIVRSAMVCRYKAGDALVTRHDLHSDVFQHLGDDEISNAVIIEAISNGGNIKAVVDGGRRFVTLVDPERSILEQDAADARAAAMQMPPSPSSGGDMPTGAQNASEDSSAAWAHPAAFRNAGSDTATPQVERAFEALMDVMESLRRQGQRCPKKTDVGQILTGVHGMRDRDLRAAAFELARSRNRIESVGSGAEVCIRLKQPGQSY